MFQSLFSKQNIISRYKPIDTKVCIEDADTAIGLGGGKKLSHLYWKMAVSINTAKPCAKPLVTMGYLQCALLLQAGHQ